MSQEVVSVFRRSKARRAKPEAACRAATALPVGVAIVVPDLVEVRPNNLSKEISTTTTATVALTELAEKGADIDVLRQMVQFMAQRLRELE
jgi:ribosomal protein L25 (general stress protein Ctc)